MSCLFRYDLHTKNNANSDKCDRERDYDIVWSEFERRFAE